MDALPRFRLTYQCGDEDGGDDVATSGGYELEEVRNERRNGEQRPHHVIQQMSHGPVLLDVTQTKPVLFIDDDAPFTREFPVLNEALE